VTPALPHSRVIRALHALLGLGLIGMVVLNVVNAVGRYAGLPMLTGADELLVYAMIWIVMVGAILAARTREHLAIDLLPAVLPRDAARQLRLFTDAITCAVSGFMAWHSFAFIGRIAAIGQTSMGLGVPMTVPHAAIFVGFAGISAVSFLLLISDIRGRT
jgi:TRAP-type C4-dicarboxylate transport system permease small subunit